MDDPEAQAIRRENEYLKARCAQLQDDVADLSSQLERSQRQLERAAGSRSVAAPNPLAGGQ